MCLKNIVSDEMYNHFLLLNIGSENIQIAEDFLTNYVEGYPIIFGENKVSFNVHNLLHLVDCVSQFGYLDSFSAYKFENYMQFLKHKIRKPNLILQQLQKRMFKNLKYP